MEKKDNNTVIDFGHGEDDQPDKGSSTVIEISSSSDVTHFKAGSSNEMRTILDNDDDFGLNFSSVRGNVGTVGFLNDNLIDAYPKEAIQTTQLLFINFGEKETCYCLPAVAKARAAGIRTEIYPDAAKMKKQMSYANAKLIPFVALAGENEISQGKLTLKNMATGEQQLVTPDELVTNILNK